MARITDPPLIWLQGRTEGWRRRWRLKEPLYYGLEGPDGPTWIEVEAGFEFDMLSIPLFVAWILGPLGFSPDSSHPSASALHDLFYQNGGWVNVLIDDVRKRRQFSRADADSIFRDVLISTGTPRWRANLFHLAVRLFGEKDWGEKLA